jgi:ABC-2 type transport system permease protein
MSSPSTAAEIVADAPASGALKPTRPFYWSLRREIWEYRSVYFAPLAAAGVALFGFVVSLHKLPGVVRAIAKLPPMEQYAHLDQSYAFAAAAVLLCGVIVALFYCLGALNGERRDRSILFWKSLPVSDLTSVLAKVTVPLAVIPVVLFVVILVTQLVMLLLGSAVLVASGLGAGVIWSHWPVVSMAICLAYIVVIQTLWYAPLYGWFLLVSGFARRVPILWAVLPPLGLCLVEKMALGTNYIGALIVYRFRGFALEGFTVPPSHAKPESVDPLALLTPAHFFAAPGLWLGLVVALACFAAAVWLRRYREPG